MKKMRIWYIGCMLLLTNTYAADSLVMTQTKNKLKILETKMSQLQHNLHNTHDKQGVINKELQLIEKKIQAGALELKKIQQSMVNEQAEIAQMQLQVDILSAKLNTQQHLLAEHVRARYQMGEYQPLKWLLNQDTPDSMNRLLTSYQYLIRKRQFVMDDVIKIKKTLTQKHAILHQQIAAKEHLQQQLNARQESYDHDKRYRTALIKSLAKDIEHQQKTLVEYQRNKNNLSQILATLVQKSVIQTRHPFNRMRKKLQKPVTVNSEGIQKINQGVVFFANEDAPVAAVFPGKVVFADRLNGYGLLLIIDHGWGFMTLYANNKTLIKHKGDIVNQGEKIAFVGHTGTFKQNGLYFEVRQRGKAINPLEWMS